MEVVCTILALWIVFRFIKPQKHRKRRKSKFFPFCPSSAELKALARTEKRIARQNAAIEREKKNAVLQLLEDPDENEDSIEDPDCSDDELVTDKERKKELEIGQAIADAEFYQYELDGYSSELETLYDDIKVSEDYIEVAMLSGTVKTIEKEKRKLEKMKAKALKLERTKHNTEKKLRIAQFKAGMQISW